MTICFCRVTRSLSCSEFFGGKGVKNLSVQKGDPYRSCSLRSPPSPARNFVGGFGWVVPLEIHSAPVTLQETQPGLSAFLSGLGPLITVSQKLSLFLLSSCILFQRQLFLEKTFLLQTDLTFSFQGEGWGPAVQQPHQPFHIAAPPDCIRKPILAVFNPQHYHILEKGLVLKNTCGLHQIKHDDCTPRVNKFRINTSSQLDTATIDDLICSPSRLSVSSPMQIRSNGLLIQQIEWLY